MLIVAALFPHPTLWVTLFVANLYVTQPSAVCQSLFRNETESAFLFAVVALTITKAVASVLPFVRDGVCVCGPPGFASSRCQLHFD